MTERHRRIVKTAAVAAQSVLERLPKDATEDTPMPEMSTGEAAHLMELQDATIVALLAGWSLDRPLPTMDTIQDLPGELYDALAEATKELGATVATGSDFSVDPDPKATTPDSEPSESS